MPASRSGQICAQAIYSHGVGLGRTAGDGIGLGSGIAVGVGVGETKTMNGADSTMN